MKMFVKFMTERFTTIIAPVDRLEFFKDRDGECRIVVLGDDTGVYDVRPEEFERVLKSLGECGVEGTI